MSEVCVRVAVRIRPLIPKEVLHNHRVCVRVVPDTAQVMLGTDRAFSFDHAFGPTATQDEVYESCVQPLVLSFIEGYNATVFAYGQTGSGKTYTLGGGHVAPLNEEDGGIIERMAHDVFLLLEERRRMSGSGVEATVHVSYMELYREELRDLLELHTAHKELHIREDDRGNTLVVGATETPVTSALELLSVLEAGNALRHTGATGMNERSSRSHAILTLQLTLHYHNKSPTNSSHSTRYSKLHIVDLAGSERAGKTGNTGTRLKESVHINTGLLALGNVIRALSDPSRHRRGNNSHIPYRDAKITRLLRDSLGGSAHTLMVACVSPSDHDVAETLSVLHFASRAGHIRNRPGTMCPRNEVKSCPTWDPREARLGELEYEIQTLREVLREKEREMEREKGGGGGGSVTDSSKQANQTDRTCDSDRKLNQEEGLQHRLLAQEAALILEDIPSPVLSPSLKQRLEDWQDRLRAISHSDHTNIKHLAESEDQSQHVTILQLRQELNKCQEALAIDEQVFQQKEVELREVQKELQKLLQENKSHLQSLEEEREHTRIQCDQLVEQQMLLDRLRGELLTLKLATSGVSVEAKHSGNSAGRPHSVPLIRHSCGHGPVRKIHTSPPAYSLERVMAAFKMRGQLLLAELEEKDQVYCPFIKQLEEEEEEENEERMGFRRSMNRTWTSRQKKPAQRQNSTGPVQNCKSGIQLPQRTKLTTGDEESSAKQCLKEAGLDASVTRRRIQELSINMRMKEELINELDKTGKEAREADRHGRHGDDSCVAGEADRHGRHGDDSCVAGLTKGVLTSLSLQSRKARAELQQSLQHMRQQREQLQTRLRQQQDTTAHPDQSRELRAEDLTVVQNGDDEGLKEKSHHSVWLEAEEEVVLRRRAELLELEEELRRREEVLQRREACLQQRNKLEIKRLRSSQVLSQDLLHVSSRLECLEEQLEGSSEAGQTGVTSLELKRERDALRLRREALDTQLREGRVLTAQEEHALLQLEEAIEALDTAVDFKSRSIQDRQKQLSVTAYASQSHSAEPALLCDVISKLRELSPPEASELLVKYFNKVVGLREEERRLRLRCEELQLQSGEQEGLVRELEAALQRLALDTDRRLTQQHREHQHSIQLLLQKLREGGAGETEQALQTRVQQLEKDLFFYKSSSRELKKKLKELLNDSLQPSQPDPQPSHTHPTQTATQNHQTYAKTHTNRTYTQTHSQIQNKQTDTQTNAKQTHAQQNPYPSSSSDLQTHKRTLAHTQTHTHSVSQGREGGGEGHNVQLLNLKPVRLSRRELRQISPADLQLPSSTTRECHSVVKTSAESIFEDSIEISKNTD